MPSAKRELIWVQYNAETGELRTNVRITSDDEPPVISHQDHYLEDAGFRALARDFVAQSAAAAGLTLPPPPPEKPGP